MAATSIMVYSRSLLDSILSRLMEMEASVLARVTRRGISISALAVLCYFSRACSHAPALIPHIEGKSIGKQIDDATLIVLGTVKNDRVLRKKDPVELHQVEVSVEGVLEGQYKSNVLTFYFWLPYVGLSTAPVNFVYPGTRNVFYLVSDAGVLRATTDWYLSHTEIVSGEHRISPKRDKQQVREAVAELLFVPSDGIDWPIFLSRLENSKNLAVDADLVPKARLAELLQDLVKNPDPQVRGRACIVLASFPLKEKGCLQDVMNDPQTSSEDRTQAQALAAKP